MIVLWKNGEKVATSGEITLSTILDVPDLTPYPMWVYYFSRLRLENIVAFEHIAGASLSGFLDYCDMTDDEAQMQVKRLRYVHGGSEVMKGKPSVTSVLLARLDQHPISDLDWIPLTPLLWNRFQRVRAQRNI